MDGVQPFKESCGGSTIDLGSEVKCERETSVKNEYEMDNYVIKEESFEDTDEKSIPIEIKNELDNEHETISQNLKVLKDIKRKVLRYPCNECNYAATTAGNLKQHKESKHEGIRYPCNECDYAATTTWNLKKHKKRKH